MTLPLALILSYVIAIPFWYWVCSYDDSSSDGLFDKASESMPRVAWLFQLGGNIHGYLISPIALAMAIICLPILCIQHFLKKRAGRSPRYSDPCFERVNAYVLEKGDGRRFDEFEKVLVNRGFDLIGTYKYLSLIHI